ncbi:MAG: hypothetical protein K1X81_04465 [Bacteroidia bacterium]|nr:hypothetical protein [Bacteroidia bacterium]
MKIDLKQLEVTYKTYGFEVKHEEENIASFLFKKSRYFGVDIVPLVSDEETKGRAEKIKLRYSALGYASYVKCFKDIRDVERELFKSFFSYDLTILRLKKKYNDFVNKQTKALLGNKYEYIESPFEVYEQFDNNNNNLGLLEKIKGIISTRSPQLLIIEAAAGYGKTCAAYEILNTLTDNKSELVSPLFTELSKNRGAKIFRYILLDEIDLEFPTLNSELVIHEIKNGRIPLIIDGFDELLEKVNISDSDVSKSFDEIETMLDTIGNLLEKNAKIILTTRKTAIFSGLEFDKWLAKWNTKFNVTRLTLKEPRIKDWVGTTRFNQIKDRNIPIQYIANPVLLTYLKNISREDFLSQIISPDLLVKQYFDRMLEREKERQNLIITKEKQYEIFKNVAKLLLEFDITVESKEFFKEIIKDQNSKLLEYTRTLYSGAEKPTLENLVDTLATHALLDRKGRDESQIGFINDFVLGILIGEIICESPVEKIEKDYSYYMLDLACTAYKVQNKRNKQSLWEKVNSVTHKLQPISIFNYDIILREELERDYYELSVYDTTFFNIPFLKHSISNSVFLNCYFKACIFDPIVFNGVSFVDCTFDACKVENSIYLDSTKEISSIKSKLKECEILEHYDYHSKQDNHLFDEVEEVIIKELWSISSTKSQHILKLLHKLNTINRKLVMQSLNQLEYQGYIQIRGSQINFNINKIQEIRDELQL